MGNNVSVLINGSSRVPMVAKKVLKTRSNRDLLKSHGGSPNEIRNCYDA